MTHIDVKAYAVGEMSADEKRSAAEHVTGCEACREELAGLQATLGSLAMLRDEEVPRRIAFVSDKVFEPRWWQRANPMLASACVLAVAIVAHGYVTPAPVNASVQAEIQQLVDQAVAREIETRMPILDQEVKRLSQVRKAAMQLVGYN
jgi:anti-sigma factor RsiW